MSNLFYLFKNFDRWHWSMQMLFYAGVIICGCILLGWFQGII